MIPNYLIHQVLCMQKEQQKYDPNLQTTWQNIYVNVYAIFLLLFTLPKTVEQANK